MYFKHSIKITGCDTWHHTVIEGAFLDAEHHLRHLPQPLVCHTDGHLMMMTIDVDQIKLIMLILMVMMMVTSVGRMLTPLFSAIRWLTVTTLRT